MTDEKLKSKNGHAISSDVTDANPKAYSDIGLLERTIVRLSHENDILRGKLAQQQPVTYHDDKDYSSPMRPKRLEYTMCGKEADNGHDRENPPNYYECKSCELSATPAPNAVDLDVDTKTGKE